MLLQLVLLLYSFSVIKISGLENNVSLISNFEHNQNYSFIHTFANATCDLTENFCDSFCCEDKDCNEWQKQSFQCSNSTQICDKIFPHWDCNCNKSDKPEWFPLLCFVYKNPIYLGMFYSEPKKIESLNRLNSLINKKKYLFKNKKEKPKTYSLFNSVSYYKYKSPLKIYFPGQDFSKFPSITSLPIKIPIAISRNACKQGYVRFRVNEITFCFLKITEDLCKNSYTLGILPYLVQEGNMSSSEGIPFILKTLDFLESASTQVVIKCASLSYQIKKFGKKIFNIFYQENIQPCNVNFNSTRTIWKENVCHNVLINIHHEFIVNSSDIKKHLAHYTIANISVLDHVSLKTNKILKAATYVKQIFNITFYDVVQNVSEKKNFSDDAFLNRGYYIKELLNFGYKGIKNSSVFWKRGSLAVFQNGRTCEHLTPVTFGYNFFSYCRLAKKFSNCKDLSNYIEQVFDALIKGNSVAPYSLFRSPYDDPVPLLRNYSNGSINYEKSNSTFCNVSLTQDIFIQYTSTPIINDQPVYRIIGIRSDRKYENGTVSQISGRYLVSRVIFFDVTLSNRNLRSRFWEKIYSEEKSENSWLNIFEAFEGETNSEIIFWVIMLTLGSSIIIIFTKVNVNYENQIQNFPKGNSL